MDWKLSLKFFIINILPILIFLSFVILFFANSKSIEGFTFNSQCNKKKNINKS